MDSLYLVNEIDDKHIKSLIEYTNVIESEVEILKLGIDYKSYQRYRDFIDISPLERVSLADSPDDMLVYRNKSRLLKEDSELQDWLTFSFTFVLDCIIRWQLVKRPGLYEAFSDLSR